MRRYGYDEEEITGHTVDWLNFTILFHQEQELEQVRFRERLRLQNSLLVGMLFNDPKAGMEMYEHLMGALGDDDASDEAWITNPNATTNVTELEKVLQRRADDRRRDYESRHGSDATREPTSVTAGEQHDHS